MTTTPYSSLALRAVAVLFVCAGCADTGDKASAPASADSAPAAASSSTRAVELTNESLRAYERGLRKEIEAVRAAQQRSSSAKSAQERGEAIQASFEDATIPQGADAAGLDVEQYRELRETIDEIFRTLDFQGKIDGPLSIDLSRVNEATKQRLSRDPFADLSPESSATLRAQMDRLVPVWIEYVTLTAVAG